MPRPKRPGWIKITITVSEEVATSIRVKAAERNIMMGTFVDELVRLHSGIPKPPAVNQSSVVKPLIPQIEGTNADAESEDCLALAFAGCQGESERIAAFLHQEALASPISGVFSPVRFLKDCRGQANNGMTYSAFESFVTGAIELMPIDGCETWDEDVRSQLDSLLVGLDLLAQKFDEELPYKSSVVWTPDVARAFGSAFAELILEGDGTLEEVMESADRVARMVRNLNSVYPTTFTEEGRTWDSDQWSLHLQTHDSDPDDPEF